MAISGPRDVLILEEFQERKRERAFKASAIYIYGAAPSPARRIDDDTCFTRAVEAVRDL